MILALINTAFQTTVITCAVIYFFPNSTNILRKSIVTIAKEVVRHLDYEES